MKEMKMYCICCCQLVAQEGSARVFRTGFFRDDIPIGICCSCSKLSRNAVFVNGNTEY